MRRIYPEPGDVDPVEAYLAVERPAPDDRPWLCVGMATTLDGATAIDGVSAAIGGEGDRAVFRAVRAIADVILVAAGTIRAEDYGPVQASAEVRAARAAAGRRPGPARLAIVTSSGDLRPDARVFSGDVPPYVFVTQSTPPARVDALSSVAEVVRCGDERADLPAVLRHLRDDGHAVAVAEGGPSLNGALVEAGLVDEWCLTLAAAVAGGRSPRITGGIEVSEPQNLDLASLLVADDGALFGRWVRSGRR